MLEVGGGLGVLSEHLAERVAHVHVVELDRTLEPALRDALDAHPNTTLHFADAVKLDLAALDPPPDKVVANLPYGVAATVILRTVAELPRVTTWVAMVQKEVGQRLAAKPGTPAYGVPSVLAQLACDVRVLRPVSRTVFHPVPNVDSVLVGLTRRGPAPEPALRTLVSQGFAHRRKALARSLSLAPGAEPGIRDRARAALAAIGRPPDARAEQLAPDGVARPPGGAGAMRRMRAAAPGKVNLCLFIGRARQDGYHPLVSLVQPVSIADELELEPADGDADEVVCPGVDGENLAARAIARFRAETGWDGPPVRLTITKRVPVAAGMGGGSADAAAALRLVAAVAEHDRSDGALQRIAVGLGADVPSQLEPERCLMTGIGEGVRRARRPRRVRPADRPLGAPPEHPGGLRRARPPRPRPRRRRARPPQRPGPGRGARGQPARRAPAPQRPRGAGPQPLPADRGCARRRPRVRRGPRDGLRLGPDGVRDLPRRGRRRARPRRRRGAAPASSARRRGRPGRPRLRRAAGGLSVHPLWIAGAVALVLYLVVRRRHHGKLTLGVGALAAAGALLIGFGVIELPNVEHLIEDAGQALGKWTYLAVGILAFLETGAFIGLVAPGETTVIVGGLVAGQGEISLFVLIAIVWACAVAGDLTSYTLGRRLGREFMVKHGARVKITEERLEQVEAFFDRRGGSTILIGRFIGLVRAIAPFIAGASKMPLRKFLPYDILGAGLWATTFCVLGYVFWRSFDQLTAWVSRGLFAFGLFVAVVVAIVFLVRLQRSEELQAKTKAWIAEQLEKPYLRPVAPYLRAGWERIGQPAARASEAPARFVWNRLTPGDLGLEVTTLLAIAAVGSFVFFLLADGLSERDLLVGDRVAADIADRIRMGWLVDLVEDRDRARLVRGGGDRRRGDLAVGGRPAPLPRRGRARRRLAAHLPADPHGQSALRPAAAGRRARRRRRERLPERARGLLGGVDRLRGRAGADRRQLGRPDGRRDRRRDPRRGDRADADLPQRPLPVRRRGRLGPGRHRLRPAGDRRPGRRAPASQ